MLYNSKDLLRWSAYMVIRDGHVSLRIRAVGLVSSSSSRPNSLSVWIPKIMPLWSDWIAMWKAREVTFSMQLLKPCDTRKRSICVDPEGGKFYLL